MTNIKIVRTITKGEKDMVYEDEKNIKVGNKYHYMFGIFTKEGLGECDITITHIRSGVIFYIVDNHPEMDENHFEINSYMAGHLELISKGEITQEDNKIYCNYGKERSNENTKRLSR